MSLPEPWLRGLNPELHPVPAALLSAFQQVIEDLREWTADLSDAEVWARPMGLAPVGFQIRHIAGSVGRLMTYVREEQLSQAQIDALRAEMEPGQTLAELLSGLEAALRQAGEEARRIDPATLADPRPVGRKALPTSVGGLLIHIAEHSQRHAGQAIVSVKILRALRP
jgi:uncharacterized damage-inducible protein DinB